MFSVVIALACTTFTSANVSIKNRTVSEPIVLDQAEDYVLHKVYVSGITDMAALTLAGRIHSVTMTQCVFSNILSGMNGKAVCAESTGAMVGAFTAVDSAFEDAQQQLMCLREGAFGTVSFTRCRFKTSDAFLKKIYADDPWRTSPPTTEFANIERLELIDNEYSNTILVIHPSVKLVVFRGDLTNVRLQSPNTQVIRLEKDRPMHPGLPGGSAVASAPAQPDPHAAPAPPAPERPRDEQPAEPTLSQTIQSIAARMRQCVGGETP